MNGNRKRFRNAGILLAAVCVVIGIAVVKQDGKELPEEISVSVAEEREQAGEGRAVEDSTGDTVTDALDTESPESEKQCGGYRYKILADDTVEVIAYEGSETTLFIPAYMEDRAVTVIGPEAFKGNKTAERIYLPQGALKIGEEAFAGCSALRDIYITETVESIGKRAMADCPLIEEIVFPEAVSRIEAMTCQGDTGLQQITIQPAVSEIADDAFTGCDALRLVYGESEFAQSYAQENDFVYVDMERIREEGNLVW
ncbi:MAG: leucine-rich repeat domain-containing protein [Lachnospiraceae bacterium]|nr:leucine-rich repeat domain-containing protein [Lachnospiraceae bacterium]